MTRAMFPLKFTFPRNWAKNYTLFTLYERGYFTVFNTDKFGIIPQACTLSGYNVFYQPKYCMITNPQIDTKSARLEIGKNCALIKLQPNYAGVMDIVNYYAACIALCCESAGMNVQNCKLAYVFASRNKAGAESFKKMFDQISAGNPASFIDKNLFNDDGSPAWQMFNADLASTFIADDIMLLVRKYLCMFDSEVGIPNTNTEKRAQMSNDEINSNNVETVCRLEMMLETLNDDFMICREMFGIPESELNVERREVLTYEDGNTKSVGTVED